MTFYDRTRQEHRLRDKQEEGEFADSEPRLYLGSQSLGPINIRSVASRIDYRRRVHRTRRAPLFASESHRD